MKTDLVRERSLPIETETAAACSEMKDTWD